MRLSIIAAAVCLSIVGLSQAEDVGASIRKPTNIPAQALSSALQALAKQREFQVVCRADLIADLYSHEIAGDLTPGEALGQLLSGTNLTYRYLDEKTVTIVPLAAGPGQRNRDSAQQGIPATAASDKAASVVREAEHGTPKRWRLTQAEQDRQASQASSSEEDSVNQGKLEEVVVTAQKRKENLKDVPIFISVLGGDALDKSTADGITEALSRVPGVATTAALLGGGTQVAVRGVSANGALFGGSSPIAYYLDSVPFGLIKTAIAPDSSAYDLERVEVLRGPQGTLYGASAEGGLVRVLTHDANLNEFEIKARTSAASTDGGGGNYRGDMAINVPLVEGKLAARAVVGYQNFSGWIDSPNRNDVNDAEIRNLRLKINARPIDGLSIGLSAWQNRSDFGAPWLADEDGRISATLDQSVNADYDAYGLKIEYEFPEFSISSMTSYLDYSNAGALDLFPLYFIPDLFIFTGLDSKVFSQEVLLSSAHNDGSWRWTAGGMYRDAEDRLVQNLNGFINPIDYRDFSESLAVFGEVTRAFVDGEFELTAGLRYFEDEVTNFKVVPALPPHRPTSNFDAMSPRVVLTWHPRGDLTAYASYAEGFRSGFPQNAAALESVPDFPPLEEDTLKNYELGVKGGFWGGRLIYETAAYFIDWQDVQQVVTLPGPPPTNIPFTALINGTSASGVGFDLALTGRFFQGLELGANFSWNDLQMDGRVRSQGAVLFDRGDRLNYSPEYTAGISADYAFSLGSHGLKGRFSASANYTAEQDNRTIATTTAGPVLVNAQGDATLFARTSFAVEAVEHWTASLYVDNLNNEDASPIRQNLGPAEWAQRARPRTVGVQLEYRFR